MSYLELHGRTIQVLSDSDSEGIDEIGARGRAFSGTYRSTRRAKKGRWAQSTPHLAQTDAVLMRQILCGDGQSWAYNGRFASNTGAFVESLASTKGRSPTTADGVLNLGTARDGDDIVLDDVDSADAGDEYKFGNGSLSPSVLPTNILPTDVRNTTATTNFTAIGTASLAIIQSVRVRGNDALEVTAPANFDGVQTDPVAGSASVAYVASAYVKLTETVSSPETITFGIHDDSSGVIAEGSASVGNDEWVRVFVKGTSAVGTTTVWMEITSDTARDFAVCNPQIVAASVITPWIDGAATGGTVIYDVADIFDELTAGVTISAWFRVDNDAVGPVPPHLHNLLELAETLGVANNSIIFRNTGGNYDVLATGDTGGTNGGAKDLTSGETQFSWHLFTWVSDGTTHAAYLDGVVNESAALTDALDLSELAALQVGDGAFVDGTLIDDLMVLPYAADAAQVLAWFNAGAPLASLPRLLMQGDIIPNNFKRVDAELGEITHPEFQDANGFQANSQLINFTLREV